MTAFAVKYTLKERWRDIRNGMQNKQRAIICIDFALDALLISEHEHELWIASLASCPGHDDEGGRDWCAYCGNMGPKR